MKYIFLDLDGVINTSVSWKVKLYSIKESCLAALADVVENTGAKIVLTSSWKTVFSTVSISDCSPQIKELIRRLNNYGIKIYDKTPIRENRYDEIEAYLRRNFADGYVIIDDDKDLFPTETKNLYIVNAETGLTMKDTKKIKGILKKTK